MSSAAERAYYPRDPMTDQARPTRLERRLARPTDNPTYSRRLKIIAGLLRDGESAENVLAHALYQLERECRKNARIVASLERNREGQ